MDDIEQRDDDGPRLAPAPLGPRFAAGAIDALGVGLVVAVLFWVHLSRTGTVMPLWTICGVALAWNVLPAWGFRATLGLALLGLRIVHHRRHDQSGGLIELAARELLGRGVLATSYLIFVQRARSSRSAASNLPLAVRLKSGGRTSLSLTLSGIEPSGRKNTSGRSTSMVSPM